MIPKLLTAAAAVFQKNEPVEKTPEQEKLLEIIRTARERSYFSGTLGTVLKHDNDADRDLNIYMKNLKRQLFSNYCLHLEERLENETFPPHSNTMDLFNSMYDRSHEQKEFSVIDARPTIVFQSTPTDLEVSGFTDAIVPVAAKIINAAIYEMDAAYRNKHDGFMRANTGNPEYGKS